MSTFTDSEILAIASKLISPFDASKVQPASYDLALHPDIRVLSTAAGATVDLRTDDPSLLSYPAEIEPEGYHLRPGECVLGSTIESVRCPIDCVARVEGKSSLGRIFLAVHVTAGFVDPGFEGQITLEIVNHSPWNLVLWPGMPIAQINFARTSGPCARPYGSSGLGSHYQGQRGPTPAAGKRGI
jgi:dCTP deaminase